MILVYLDKVKSNSIEFILSVSKHRNSAMANYY